MTDQQTPSGTAPLSWFRVSAPVGQRSYALVGISLGAFKYIVEGTFVFLMTGDWYTPIDFVNPWLSSRAPFLADIPAAATIWLIFTIPFVWIAIAMSVRRAADIGISPWWGLLMLIPLLNLLIMLMLAVLPSGLLKLTPDEVKASQRRRSEMAAAFGPPADEEETPRSRPLPRDDSPLAAALAAMTVGTVTQVGIGMFSVWAFQLYGLILFFAAPVIAGAASGFVFNQHHQRGGFTTIGIVTGMNVASMFAMLGVGLDGAICLMMAYPLLFPLTIIGALVGRSIALSGLRPGMNEKKGMIGTIIMLPLCLALESLDDRSPVHAVTTSVEIDAPPSVVWNNVISFPDIESDMAWYFRAGIAAPLRARIDGEGVGAVRHCEFTTGTFVEPITVWSEPEHLAFDVASQPKPMTEWTPFAHLHPPHLDTGFVSHRGEFRLEALPDGRTRLHGTTWYSLDVRPRLYWKGLADPMLHSIHYRVLEHIATQAERDSQG